MFKKEHTRAFLAVFHYSQIRLRDLFGMELVQSTTREKGKQAVSKLKHSYVLRSVPEMLEGRGVEWKDDEEIWMPLLVTILSLILAQGRSLSFGTVCIVLLD